MKIVVVVVFHFTVLWSKKYEKREYGKNGGGSSIQRPGGGHSLHCPLVVIDSISISIEKKWMKKRKLKKENAEARNQFEK